LFRPTWSRQDRAEELARLVGLVEESNMAPWAKFAVQCALTDLRTGATLPPGKPAASHASQMRIAYCVAWMDSQHNGLQKKQRKGIVSAILNEAPRALTTLPPATRSIAASTLASWSGTPEGEALTEALNREAAKALAVKLKVRKGRAS
jgi:hypothetical protein